MPITEDPGFSSEGIGHYIFKKAEELQARHIAIAGQIAKTGGKTMSQAQQAAWEQLIDQVIERLTHGKLHP